MPTSPEDSLRSGIYPDDLDGFERLIIHEDYEEGFWDADDDDDAQDLPDDCNHGWWLPVESSGPDDDPRWVAAPEMLREWLVRHNLRPGDRFRVTDVSRGEQDHDPYELELEELSDE